MQNQKPSFAVLRTAKLKSLTQIRSALNHNHRMIPLDHSCNKNEPLNYLGDFGQCLSSYKSKIPSKVRSNAVLALEYLFTASPEYFRPDDPDSPGTYDQKRLDDFAVLVHEFIKEEGLDSNSFSCDWHLDEATPHCHLLFVPIDKKGKLNAASFIGSPQILRDLQTRFANKLSSLELKRGIDRRKTNSRHVPIREFYQILRKLDFATLKQYAKAGIALAFNPISSSLEKFRKRKLELK